MCGNFKGKSCYKGMSLTILNLYSYTWKKPSKRLKIQCNIVEIKFPNINIEKLLTKIFEMKINKKKVCRDQQNNKKTIENVFYELMSLEKLSFAIKILNSH